MMFGNSHGSSWRMLVATLSAMGVLVVLAVSASASVTAPGWEVAPGVYPPHIAPGGTANILIPVYNTGAAASSGQISVVDKLPPGLVATEAGYDGSEGALNGPHWECTVGTVVSCVNDPELLPSIPPGESYDFDIIVKASASVSGTVVNEVTVSGGGALAPSTATNSIVFGSEPSSFGLETLDGWFSDANGLFDTHAGSHPFSLTVAFFLNNENVRPDEHSGNLPVGEARDIVVNVPPGLVGNPQAVPRCTRAQFNLEECPLDTQVGVDRAMPFHGPRAGAITEGDGTGNTVQLPGYNLVPP